MFQELSIFSIIITFCSGAAKISDLQCWLSKWQQRCQEQQKGSFSPCKKAPKRRGPLTPSRHAHLRAADSDWASDFSYDSDDSNAASNNVSANLVMLAGPPGAGKTALVYALAQQLGYKVKILPTAVLVYCFRL